MQGSSIALAVALLATAGCIGQEPVESADANAADDEGTAGAGATPASAAANASAVVPGPEVELRVTSEGFYPLNPTFAASESEVPTGAVVTVTYRNNDLNPLGKHDWVLEGVEGASTVQIGVGEEATARFVAPAPGEYAYFCSVPGHRDRGMEGTLTVA